MSNFKTGDVVKLKSGSPPMTVDYCDNNGWKVRCSWWDDENKKFRNEWFHPPSILELVIKK